MKKIKITSLCKYKQWVVRCAPIALLIFFVGFIPFPAAAAVEQVYFYHNDHLGSPVAITDASGSVVWKADYEPFGKATTTTETVFNDHKFIGKEIDSETGLYYVVARYYDPSIGRFLTQDPVLVLGDQGKLPHSL